MGTFFCKVSAGSNTARANFCVINGEGDPLLGKDTATSLGVLKIGIGIAAVSADPKTIGGILQQKYPNVFSGVERPRSTTPHLPQSEASSKADVEDSVQHDIKVGRKD